MLNEVADDYFGTHKVSADVARALKAIGYDKPTHIQSDCIGPLLAGNDDDAFASKVALILNSPLHEPQTEGMSEGNG